MWLFYHVAAAQDTASSYPIVLLDLPVAGESSQLLPLGTVWKLEKAGEHPSVLLSIWKDGILEVDSMRQEVIIVIHPSGKERKKKSRCRLDAYGVYQFNQESERTETVPPITQPRLTGFSSEEFLFLIISLPQIQASILKVFK